MCIVILIQKRFKINYSPVQVSRILKSIGYSCQRPIERAIQQNPKLVKKWLEETYINIKKEAKKERRTIYWADEAGFHATALYGKTWSPKGKTPVIKTNGKREKINAISAISNKGVLKFMLFKERFTGKIFLQFLKRLMYQEKNKITLIVDGHKSHFTKEIKNYISSLKGKLKIYTLPPYSPELNPDELVWGNSKPKVSKRKHQIKEKKFERIVKEVLTEIKNDPNLVRSFFCENNVAYAM